jgi:hypothetical protein
MDDFIGSWLRVLPCREDIDGCVVVFVRSTLIKMIVGKIEDGVE